jgi:RNA polymerase subunit RPABC4/transcription elongation factor Spt4
MARLDGMSTLIEDGLEKVRRGLTTLDELLRVLGPQTGNERTCEQCQRIIDGKFAFCPHCGAFRNNYCHTCRLPLEKEWTRCPFCGQIK